MATLTRRFTWKKWAPDIGENRELLAEWEKGGKKGPCPGLYLELATGLTAEQMDAVFEHLRTAREVEIDKPVLEPGASVADIRKAFRESTRAYLAKLRAVIVEAMGPYVRVHDGPHTVDGQQLATLDDYLKLVEPQQDTGLHARQELEHALSRFNSIEGPDELFSLPRSGGGRSTGSQGNDAAESPTGSP